MSDALTDGVRPGIWLVCCTEVIKQEVTFKGATRKSIGLTYAMAMRSEAAKADKPDWKAINQAILARWGIKGLEAVKQRAWRLFEGREQP